jgi:predicted nuclease of predicted toxin-antitoxin system
MRFMADENFNGKILDALLARFPDLDVVRVQDTDLYSASDPKILAWAAQENRIVLTHDVQTLVDDAYARIRASLPMPGVILVLTDVPIGKAIHQIEIMIGAGTPEDFDHQIKYVSR